MSNWAKPATPSKRPPPACRAHWPPTLLREDAQPAITPVIVADLCAEVGLDQKSTWQPPASNSASPARSSTNGRSTATWSPTCSTTPSRMPAACPQPGPYRRPPRRGLADLQRRDDGPGFATLPPACGTGLTVAHRLAFLHRRQERDGSLHLSNGASLGGARFELRLP